MANIPEISLPAEKLGQIGPLVVSNALFSSIIVSLILFTLAFLIRRKAGVIPSRPQVLFEVIMEFLWDKAEMAFGSKERAQKFFPFIFTIFLTLIIANQFTLIPFVESVLLGDTTLFRTPTSHYSMPIAFAIFTLLMAHVLALLMHPLKHIGNFIKIKQFFTMKSIRDFPMAFLDFFLGLLDIIGEIAKLASVSTRLFGNMFAGSIVVSIIAGLSIFTRYFVPIPFVVLGILSGLVQAFVFAMLLILYISSTLNAVRPAEEMEKITI